MAMIRRLPPPERFVWATRADVYVADESAALDGGDRMGRLDSGP